MENNEIRKITKDEFVEIFKYEDNKKVLINCIETDIMKRLIKTYPENAIQFLEYLKYLKVEE